MEHSRRSATGASTGSPALAPIAPGVIDEIFADYDPMPFGLELEEFTGFAMAQFRQRYARIEKARGANLEKVQHREPALEIEFANETPSKAAS